MSRPKYLSLFALTAIHLPAQTARNIQVPPTSPQITLLGRYDATDANRVRLAYPGSGFTVRFTGSSLPFTIESDTATCALTLIVDTAAPQLALLTKGVNTLTGVKDLDPGEHTLTVYKRTETWQGVLTFTGLQISGDTQLLPPLPLPQRKLLFLGDSVTCGAGVDNTPTCKPDPTRPANNAFDSYGMILGRHLDAQTHLVCYGGRGLIRDYRGFGSADGVLNAPQFLDLAIPTDNPPQRAPWNTAQYIPDAIVVSLGTNDFNLQRSKPLEAENFTATYVTLLQRLRTEYPHALIFATEGAIVTDPLLRQYIQAAITRVHDSNIRYVRSTHYPGNGCDGHPTAAQHRRMADDFEPTLRDALHWGIK